jgi:large subunit ribosomal protein L6
MSRIGKKPVSIPSGVKVEVSGQTIKAAGPKGNLEMNCHPKLNVRLDNQTGRIIVENPNLQARTEKALYGTTRALISNMITGVSKGFEKKMEIYGTGYSVKEQSGKLVVQVGFSHPIEIAVPKGIKVLIGVPATKGNDIPAKFTLTGCDKHELGQFAANIRRVRPPEPYQGKGIRYADEHVRKKAGKAFASGATV